MKHDPSALEAILMRWMILMILGLKENTLHPPINYMGNKFGQLDFILPLLPWHETYVEVFGGSGAVLFAKKPSKLEVFNDRFSGTVALYKCIQSDDKLQALRENIQMLLTLVSSLHGVEIHGKQKMMT